MALFARVQLPASILLKERTPVPLSAMSRAKELAPVLEPPRRKLRLRLAALWEKPLVLVKLRVLDVEALLLEIVYWVPPAPERVKRRSVELALVLNATRRVVPLEMRRRSAVAAD